MSQVHSKDYTHCDGTQLRLTDSDLGSEQYSSSDYYVWNAGPNSRQLLFIFPTRVNLTTITLHYYSDNIRGLPGLRFYAVHDDFDVWDAPATAYRFVDVNEVPHNGEPASRESISKNISHFNTTKVLMYRSRSYFEFAVSEVQFFTCNSKAYMYYVYKLSMHVYIIFYWWSSLYYSSPNLYYR